MVSARMCTTNKEKALHLWSICLFFCHFIFVNSFFFKEKKILLTLLFWNKWEKVLLCFKNRYCYVILNPTPPSKIMKDFFITYVLWALSLITTDRINLSNQHSFFSFVQSGNIFILFQSFSWTTCFNHLLRAPCLKGATPVVRLEKREGKIGEFSKCRCHQSLSEYSLWQRHGISALKTTHTHTSLQVAPSA